MWSQSDVFNYIGQNPRRLFPRLQPVSERSLEPLSSWGEGRAGTPSPSLVQTSTTPGWSRPTRQPVRQRHRGHSAPEPSLVPPRPSRPPHGRTGSQFQVLLASEGSLSQGSTASRAGRVGKGRGPPEPGQEAGDADSTSPSFSRGAKAERGAYGDLESILRVLLRIPAMGPGSRARDISESCADPPSPLSTPPQALCGTVPICILKALRRPPSQRT